MTAAQRLQVEAETGSSVRELLGVGRGWVLDHDTGDRIPYVALRFSGVCPGGIAVLLLSPAEASRLRDQLLGPDPPAGGDLTDEDQAGVY